MEPAVTMMNGGEWSSFNGGGWCEGEEADFMAQFFSSCLFPSEVPDEGFLHGHEYMMAGAGVDHGGSFFSSESNNSEHSKENSYSTDTFSAPNHPCTMLPENYCLTDPNNQYLAADDTSSTMLPIDLFTLINAREGNGGDRAQAFPTGTRMEEPEACQLTDEIENTAADKQQHLQINSSYSHMRADLDLSVEDRNNSNSSKKRQRTSHDHVSKQKEKKYAKSRKNLKTGSTCDRNKEEDDGAPPPLDGQSSGSCSSEDDDFSGCHQDMNGGSSQSQENNSSNSTISTKRASRGSATDPQSLYARRRRERINERLRILQNLVPNGTKVDISTMLEEAAQYVKFLQLQIKMLSSDDLWMYSPIAYNGLDLNLNNLAN